MNLYGDYVYLFTDILSPLMCRIFTSLGVTVIHFPSLGLMSPYGRQYLDDPFGSPKDCSVIRDRCLSTGIENGLVPSSWSLNVVSKQKELDVLRKSINRIFRSKDRRNFFFESRNSLGSGCKDELKIKDLDSSRREKFMYLRVQLVSKVMKDKLTISLV